MHKIMLWNVLWNADMEYMYRIYATLFVKVISKQELLSNVSTKQ